MYISMNSVIILETSFLHKTRMGNRWEQQFTVKKDILLYVDKFMMHVHVH